MIQIDENPLQGHQESFSVDSSSVDDYPACPALSECCLSSSEGCERSRELRGWWCTSLAAVKSTDQSIANAMCGICRVREYWFVCDVKGFKVRSEFVSWKEKKSAGSFVK